jgi:hypothetical protein
VPSNNRPLVLRDLTISDSKLDNSIEVLAGLNFGLDHHGIMKQLRTDSSTSISRGFKVFRDLYKTQSLLICIVNAHADQVFAWHDPFAKYGSLHAQRRQLLAATREALTTDAKVHELIGMVGGYPPRGEHNWQNGRQTPVVQHILMRAEIPSRTIAQPYIMVVSAAAELGLVTPTIISNR